MVSCHDDDVADGIRGQSSSGVRGDALPCIRRRTRLYVAIKWRTISQIVWAFAIGRADANSGVTFASASSRLGPCQDSPSNDRLSWNSSLSISFMCQVVEGGGDAAFLMRHAGQLESHLDAAQSTGEHEIVEVAEVTDAEDLILQTPQTGAERHIEMIEHNLAEFVRVVAGRSE